MDADTAASASSTASTEDGFWHDLDNLTHALAQNATLTSLDGGVATFSVSAFLAKYPISILFGHIYNALQNNDGDLADKLSEALRCIVTSDAVLSDPKLTAAILTPDNSSQPINIVYTLACQHLKLRRVSSAFFRTLACKSRAVASSPISALLTDDILSQILQSLVDEDTQVGDDIAETFALLAGAAPAVQVGVQPPGDSRRSKKTALTAVTAEDRSRIISLISGFINGGSSSTGVISRDNFLALDSVLQVRLLHLLLRISEVDFTAIQHVGVVDILLSMVADADDPLLQLNVMELLVPLVGSADGRDAFITSGLWESLAAWAGVKQGDGAGSDDMDPLIGPASLTTLCGAYAAIARSNSERVSELRATLVPGLFTQTAALCATGSDTPTSVLAIDAVCTALSADVELLAEAIKKERMELTREWMECIASSTPELRAASFAGLASIFENADAEHISIYNDLYDRVTKCSGSEPTAAALSSLKKPVDDARLAAFHFLSALGAVPAVWAVRAVLTVSEALTYLLDRSTETSKLGKEWKFAVLNALVRNPFLDEAVGPYFADQLRAFVAKGPYYVEVMPATVAIATE